MKTVKSNWRRLLAAIRSFAERVEADEKEPQENLGMSDVAVYDLWRVKDFLDGVLFLVLPTQWGRTQTVDISYNIVVVDCLHYDVSLTHEFFPLLWKVAEEEFYHNELDDLLVEVMNYFTNKLKMF